MKSLGPNRSWIRSRERNEQIARAIAGVGSVASQSKRSPPPHALQLHGNQGRISRNYDNDRAGVFLPDLRRWNFASDVNPGNAQLFALTVIALDEHSNRVPSLFRAECA